MFINLSLFKLLYTQDNVYKNLDTNWDEKATRDTKNHVPWEYGKKDIFDNKFLWNNVAIGGRATIAICIQDILLLGLRLLKCLFCLVLAVLLEK